MDFPPEQVERYELHPGDILLNEGQSPEMVGRPAMYRGELPGVCFTNSLIRFKAHNGIDKHYALYLFLHHLKSGRFQREARITTNIAHLSAARFASVEFRVPPQAEQARIVAAIEEHLSRLDAAEAAVSSAQSRCAALQVLGLQSLFSDEWPRRRIGELARVGSGATPSRSEKRYWAGGSVPWVTSGALNHRRITSPSELITKDALRDTSVKLWPAGTVLVAMYGEGKTRGKAAQLAIESTCNQACAAIDFDRSEVDGNYLLAYLNGQYEMNRKLASGGVQPNLNLGFVRDMEVPLPSLHEQRKIAARAEEILEGSHRFFDACLQLRQMAAALRRSILAAAFSGRLVAQDPSDASADALLARIAAERPPATTGRRRIRP